MPPHMRTQEAARPWRSGVSPEPQAPPPRAGSACRLQASLGPQGAGVATTFPSASCRWLCAEAGRGGHHVPSSPRERARGSQPELQHGLIPTRQGRRAGVRPRTDTAVRHRRRWLRQHGHRRRRGHGGQCAGSAPTRVSDHPAPLTGSPQHRWLRCLSSPASATQATATSRRGLCGPRPGPFRAFSYLQPGPSLKPHLPAVPQRSRG